MNIELCVSCDGSMTAIHSVFNESYHSLKCGAMTETLQKHILPPIHYVQTLKRSRLRILDICFGLGYNTFFIIWSYLRCGFKGQIEIYSPEREIEIFEILTQINYPQEISILGESHLQDIIASLKTDFIFQAFQYKIECYIGDARDYISTFETGFFDVIYQDAFSAQKNPELWSKEYFECLIPLLNQQGILTTYSQKTSVKNNLKELGLYAYELRHSSIRNSRFFSKQEIKSDFLIKNSFYLDKRIKIL